MKFGLLALNIGVASAGQVTGLVQLAETVIN